MKYLRYAVSSANSPVLIDLDRTRILSKHPSWNTRLLWLRKVAPLNLLRRTEGMLATFRHLHQLHIMHTSLLSASFWENSIWVVVAFLQSVMKRIASRSNCIEIIIWNNKHGAHFGRRCGVWRFFSASTQLQPCLMTLISSTNMHRDLSRTQKCRFNHSSTIDSVAGQTWSAKAFRMAFYFRNEDFLCGAQLWCQCATLLRVNCNQTVADGRDGVLL